MHPLDNPILHSLESIHAPFAVGSGPARRFLPEIGPLAGFRGEPGPALAALSLVTRPGDGCGFFLDEPIEAAGWTPTLSGLRRKF
ncbi:MAG: hypothetical protein HY925_14425 [Elusimicrobia bacterium]|nr:hypothetical protein [Elusimicrobiota bacterium]